jgi:hypothetical protein
MALDQEQIEALLKGDLARAATPRGSKTPTVTLLPRPVQFGPLQVFDTTGRCAQRNCSSPTHFRVNGIPKCSSHALTELNKLILEKEGFDLSTCTCKAGGFSNGHTHTVDCELYSLKDNHG